MAACAGCERGQLWSCRLSTTDRGNGGGSLDQPRSHAVCAGIIRRR